MTGFDYEFIRILLGMALGDAIIFAVVMGIWIGKNWRYYTSQTTVNR